MSLFGPIHVAAVMAVVTGKAIFKITVGLLIVGGAILLANHFRVPAIALAAVPLALMGVMTIALSLGPFAAVSSPDRHARREIRKALRQARMTRRW